MIALFRTHHVHILIHVKALKTQYYQRADQCTTHLEAVKALVVQLGQVVSVLLLVAFATLPSTSDEFTPYTKSSKVAFCMLKGGHALEAQGSGGGTVAPATAVCAPLAPKAAHASCRVLSCELAHSLCCTCNAA